MKKMKISSSATITLSLNLLQGFSLIELLMVIAIMGVLISISLPSYQHYLQRARFTEVMIATQPYKIAVTIALQEGEPKVLLNNGDHGLPRAAQTTKNLANIRVAQGVITATATSPLGGYTYILTPDDLGQSWTVSGTCLEAGLCR